MKWTNIRKLQLTTAILSILTFFTYFIDYFRVNLGFFEDYIGEAVGMAKDFFAFADFSELLDIGEYLLDGASYIMEDSPQTIVLLIALCILLFIVPMALLIATAVIGFVYFGKQKETRVPHIFAFITAAYLFASQVTISGILNKVYDLLEESFSWVSDIISMGVGGGLQIVFCFAIFVVSIVSCAILQRQAAGKSTLDETDVGISGVNGMWAGAEFVNNSGDMLVLGRDPKQCSIIISENAEKVSRKHCSVVFDYDKREYIVVDYSSNGTYVEATRERLPAGQPKRLPCGTVICLGNSANTFRLN